MERNHLLISLFALLAAVTVLIFGPHLVNDYSPRSRVFKSGLVGFVVSWSYLGVPVFMDASEAERYRPSAFWKRASPAKKHLLVHLYLSPLLIFLLTPHFLPFPYTSPLRPFLRVADGIALLQAAAGLAILWVSQMVGLVEAVWEEQRMERAEDASEGSEVKGRTAGKHKAK
ncbi:hypothetical protein JCM6882_001348 [Rhodosporidiobolus microsporus]